MRTETSAIVAVAGAGAMGSGIAQVAAAAGHQVLLFDAKPQAAEAGKARIDSQFRKLVSRNAMSAERAEEILSLIEPIAAIEGFGRADLVIEAIAENLEAKQDLFRVVEELVDQDTILATNTSSLSISAIAGRLQRPDRVVGMHFFNPPPLMKLVEVVSGLETSDEVAEATAGLAAAWGKTPVRAMSTPGFIVNRIARPFYAEALRLVEERVADPMTIDRVLIGGGFRMGPFDLMDLIGLDVNLAVTRSVFEGFAQDPRYRPSNLQSEMVAAGRLGRKSGRGFYTYDRAASPIAASSQSRADGGPAKPLPREVFVEGAVILASDGSLASEHALERGRPVVLRDIVLTGSIAREIAFCTSPDASYSQVEAAGNYFRASGLEPVPLPDTPGLVMLRTISMIVNEAYEARMNGIATEADIDLAMRLGVNYPGGPFEWARDLGSGRLLTALDNIQRLTGDPRYRASVALRREATDRLLLANPESSSRPRVPANPRREIS